MRDGEHALSPPPIFQEGKAAEGGGRLEAGSDLTVCGAGPLPSAIIFKESEPTKAWTLFRRSAAEMDRPSGRPAGRAQRVKAARCKSSALFVVRPALRAPARFTPHFCSGLRHLRAARSVRHWPVAQKQSARPISEGRRSVTVQANQFRRVNPVGIRCADSLRNLRGKFLCKHRQRCSGFVNRRGRRKPGAEIHICLSRRPVYGHPRSSPLTSFGATPSPRWRAPSQRTCTDVGRRPLSGSPFIFQPTVFP